ncbi:ROK family protein [Marinivivus vitaminiproducens]|uniref:ROK family protein n=1 Tax=Marinivivus vitaminiproducens TaxID=3035935 RepID=UPI0027A6669E|nr:ROK family protein [Geminicoccaceae bacterium SCSIO 64248]
MRAGTGDEPPVAIGVDMGGTKIEALALAASGRELVRRRVPTPKGAYEQTVLAVRDLVHGIESELGQQGTVGIGHPGAIDPTSGLIKNANSTHLLGKPLDKDLSAALERQVALANDADCLALSEATDGAGAGAISVFGVIIGTGTGGGIAIHGRVLSGPNAIAGEWGHNPLPWADASEQPGPACYCGKHGCIETFLAGPSMAADHQRVTGEALDPPGILTAAEAGDPAATATLARYEDRMARALATVVNLLDPEVIVLGGGVSRVRRLYDNVPPLLTAYAFSAGVGAQLRTRLTMAIHGDSSGVRGAAWLGRDLAQHASDGSAPLSKAAPAGLRPG